MPDTLEDLVDKSDTLVCVRDCVFALCEYNSHEDALKRKPEDQHSHAHQRRVTEVVNEQRYADDYLNWPDPRATFESAVTCTAELHDAQTCGSTLHSCLTGWHRMISWW
jgi:hypothetical protein